VESSRSEWLAEPNLVVPFWYEWRWTSGLVIRVFIHGVLTAAGYSVVVRAHIDRGETTKEPIPNAPNRFVRGDPSVIRFRVERSGTLVSNPLHPSPANLDRFVDRLVRPPGRLPLDQLTELVLRSSAWNLKMSPTESDAGVYRLAGAWLDPDSLPSEAEKDYPPYVGRLGQVYAGRGRYALDLARLWPLPIQGEGALALHELLDRAVSRRPAIGDRSPTSQFELLAWIQCVGVSDRWPFPLDELAPRASVEFDGNVEILEVPDPELEVILEQRHWSGSIDWLWSAPGIPVMVDRIGRLVRGLPDLPDVHPGLGTEHPAPPSDVPTTREVLAPIVGLWDELYQNSVDVDPVLESRGLFEDVTYFQRHLNETTGLINTVANAATHLYAGRWKDFLAFQDYHTMRNILWRWALSAPDDSGIASFLDMYATKAPLGYVPQSLEEDLLRQRPTAGQPTSRVNLLLHPTYPMFLGEVRGLLGGELSLPFAMESRKVVAWNADLVGWDVRAVTAFLRTPTTATQEWLLAQEDVTDIAHYVDSLFDSGWLGELVGWGVANASEAEQVFVLVRDYCERLRMQGFAGDYRLVSIARSLWQFVCASYEDRLYHDGYQGTFTAFRAVAESPRTERLGISSLFIGINLPSRLEMENVLKPVSVPGSPDPQTEHRLVAARLLAFAIMER